jgi:transcriptional regulator with XRE-family HTH domain
MPELTDSQRPAEVVRKAWAQTLYVERHRQRRTQVDVSEDAGVHQTTVADVERGRGSLEAFFAVANALGVTLVRVDDVDLPEAG